MAHLLRILIVLSCLSANGQSAPRENLTGRWQFHLIADTNGQSLLPITATDFLELRANGTFAYELQSKNNLQAAGQYQRAGNRLDFRYSVPRDTLRSYHIRVLNDTLLRFREGAVDYQFVRKPATAQQQALPLNLSDGAELWHWSSLGRGLLGIGALLFLTWLFSVHKRSVSWSLVFKGLAIQFLFAFAILKISGVRLAFDKISGVFVTVLSFTEAGAEFLFRGLISDTDTFGYIFAFQVLPTVIFFSALTSLLFYYGILQKVVYGFAWLMKKTLRLSGAESLAAAGNIFIGQTEAPLLVKPYIARMTRSELLSLMSGGMATIAGGVLAAYIGFLGGEDLAQQTFFAKHLLAASVMSAPAAIVAAKIIIPERESFDQKMVFSRAKVGSNALEAISNGTSDGLKLAVNVGAMLLVFIAFIAMANYILEDFIGHYSGLNQWVSRYTDGEYQGFSLQFILGSMLAPLSWIMGVDAADARLVGQLLGEKTILNEFVAYISLGEMAEAGRFQSQKSMIMATYMLCGFSNFASIGIQIGGIGVLAPSRKSDLAKLGFRALIAGTMASLFTAVLVGMLI